MKKKLITILLCACMCTTICACGKNTANETTESLAETTQTVETTESDTNYAIDIEGTDVYVSFDMESEYANSISETVSDLINGSIYACTNHEYDEIVKDADGNIVIECCDLTFLYKGTESIGSKKIGNINDNSIAIFNTDETTAGYIMIHPIESANGLDVSMRTINCYHTMDNGTKYYTAYKNATDLVVYVEDAEFYVLIHTENPANIDLNSFMLTQIKDN